MPASNLPSFILLLRNGSLELVERDEYLAGMSGESRLVTAQNNTGEQRPGKQKMVEKAARNEAGTRTTESTGNEEAPEGAGKQQPENPCMGMLWPMLIVLPVMYFLMIRPQQKKEKERKALLASVKKGEKVVTIGGIHAEVVAVHEQDGTLTLKIGSDAGQRVKVDRSAIARILGEEKAKD